MIIFAARTKRMVRLFLQEVTGVIFDGASGHSSPKLGTHFVLSSILRWPLDQISRVALTFKSFSIEEQRLTKSPKTVLVDGGTYLTAAPHNEIRSDSGTLIYGKKGLSNLKLSSKKLKTHGTRGFLANLYVFSREKTYLSRMIFNDQLICEAPWDEVQAVNLYFSCDTTVLRCRLKKNMGNFLNWCFLFLPQIWAFGWEDGLGGMYILFRVLAKRSTWWNKVKGHR